MEVIYHRITESLIKAFKFYNCEIEFLQYKNSLFADMCLGRAYNFLKAVCLNLFSWDICYLSLCQNQPLESGIIIIIFNQCIWISFL